MKSAVAIVEAPFQFMSAVEYCEKYRVDSLVVFFLKNGHANTSAQFKKITGLFRKVAKTEIKIFEQRGLLGFISAYQKVNAMFSSGEQTVLLLGNYKSVYQRVIESRIFARTIVIDDGLAVLDAIEAIVTGTEKYTSDSLKLRAISWLVLKTQKNYQLFTMLPLDLLVKYADLLPKDYHANDLAVLKKLRASKAPRFTSKYDLGIIGGPYLELGLIKRDDYFSRLKTAILRIGARSVVYIPHRREDERYVSELCERLGCALYLTKESIEISLLDGSLQCNSFLSFKSAAGFSINKLLPDVALYFVSLSKVPSDRVDKNTEDHTKAVLNAKLEYLFSSIGVVLN